VPDYFNENRAEVSKLQGDDALQHSARLMMNPDGSDPKIIAEDRPG
jgi:hypothetical protein